MAACERRYPRGEDLWRLVNKFQALAAAPVLIVSLDVLTPRTQERPHRNPPSMSSTSTSEPKENFGLKAHWRALAASTLVSLSSFQYGVDFGIIGGLQAMEPFLKVRKPGLSRSDHRLRET